MLRFSNLRVCTFCTNAVILFIRITVVFEKNNPENENSSEANRLSH